MPNEQIKTVLPRTQVKKKNRLKQDEQQYSPAEDTED
jgi:hypothetical protein